MAGPINPMAVAPRPNEWAARIAEGQTMMHISQLVQWDMSILWVDINSISELDFIVFFLIKI